MSSSKTITLRSSDGETFDLEEVVAVESQVIKHMIEGGCADNEIPLQNINSKILAMVIEYCKKHIETPKAEEHTVNDELKAWVADLVKFDRDTFVDLVWAADYLEIKSLLDLTRQTIIDMTEDMFPHKIYGLYVSMREKSLDKILEIYNIRSGVYLVLDIEVFDINLAVATQSEYIKDMIIKATTHRLFLEPNITSKGFLKVTEYCKKHLETFKAEEHVVNDELKAWAAGLFKVDQATFFDLIKAADHLAIKSLLDLTCQTVVDMTKKMSGNKICEMYFLIKERFLDKICKIYNIKTELTLQSSDSKTFDLDVAVAMEMPRIKDMIEDGQAINVIPLPSVTSKILAKVIEYCKKHFETSNAEELEAWESEFVEVNQPTLSNLIMAANYLGIKSLVDLIHQRPSTSRMTSLPGKRRRTGERSNERAFE